MAQVSFVFFLLSCIIARGARFFALAWALQRYGETIKKFIEKRLGLLAGIAAALLIGLYLAVKYLAAVTSPASAASTAPASIGGSTFLAANTRRRSCPRP